MGARPTTLGVIVGNRGFFPSHLCTAGRTEALAALERAGFGVVALEPDATPYGAVESLADARACADLFRARRDEIDGVLVTLPNFGDERAVANTLRWADARRARPHPRILGRRIADDDRAPARQLLRQDVGLQQPAPVRHPVFAHLAPHRLARPRLFPGGPAPVRRHLPRRPTSEGRPHRRDRRAGRPRSTPSGSARSCSSGPASRSRPSISPKCSAGCSGWRTASRRSRPSSPR